jgi:hypothetical protein
LDGGQLWRPILKYQTTSRYQVNDDAGALTPTIRRLRVGEYTYNYQNDSGPTNSQEKPRLVIRLRCDCYIAFWFVELHTFARFFAQLYQQAVSNLKNPA